MYEISDSQRDRLHSTACGSAGIRVPYTRNTGTQVSPELASEPIEKVDLAVPMDDPRSGVKVAPPAPSTVYSYRPKSLASTASSRADEALINQIETLVDWGKQNRREARNDKIKYWCFKLPALVCATGSSVLEWHNFHGMVVILSAVAALCIAIDSALPRSHLHNVRKRAEHDLLRLANEMAIERDKINSSHPPLDDSQLSDRVHSLLDKITAERARVSTYLKEAEAALGDDIATSTALSKGATKGSP